jgi:hypothetical protein
MWGSPNQYVLELQIILKVAGLMDESVLLKELDPNLNYRLEGEWLVELVQIVLECLSKLLLDDVSPVVLLEVIFILALFER